MLVLPRRPGEYQLCLARREWTVRDLGCKGRTLREEGAHELGREVEGLPRVEFSSRSQIQCSGEIVDAVPRAIHPYVGSWEPRREGLRGLS